ncbi:MAG: hypothetical protein WAV50_02270 [Minisyncoccia bacterium]
MKTNMMLVSALLSLIVVATPASADPTAVAGATAGATSGSAANGNVVTLGVNAAGGNAGANATGGQSTASAVSGPSSAVATSAPATATVNGVKTGDMSTGAVTTTTAITASPTMSVEIKGSEPTKIPVGVPGAIAPSVPSAQIFGGLDNPATVTGIPAVLEYLKVCKPIATRKNQLRDVFGKGASGKTQVVFSPHQDYTKKKVTASGSQNSWFNSPAVQQVETAEVEFPDKKGTYTCLGVLTVMKKEGEQGVPFTTIASDAMGYALDQMEGFEHIKFVSVRESISAAREAITKGNGLALSSGVTSAALNALTLGTLSGGYSNGSGTTYPDANIGDTFLVLSPSTDGAGVVIDPDHIRGSYRTVVQSVSEEGKKLEAVK